MSTNPAHSPMTWIKSSYSGNGGQNCLEWSPAAASAGTVPVRDSKDTRRAPLAFSADAWSAFVGMAKHDTI